MKLYTGYFARHGLHSHAYSIARGQPWVCNLPAISKLAPSGQLLADYNSGRIDWEEYAVRYFTQLNILGIEKVEEMLLDGMVLLCWEGPGKNCHRHLLAEWLQEYYHEVEELP